MGPNRSNGTPEWLEQMEDEDEEALTNRLGHARRVEWYWVGIERDRKKKSPIQYS